MTEKFELERRQVEEMTVEEWLKYDKERQEQKVREENEEVWRAEQAPRAAEV